MFQKVQGAIAALKAYMSAFYKAGNSWDMKKVLDGLGIVRKQFDEVDAFIKAHKAPSVKSKKIKKGFCMIKHVPPTDFGG